MRQIPGRTLWIGNARDGRDARALFEAGITAVIDIAHEEPSVPLPRELIHCRFPLADNGENPPAILLTAVSTAAALLDARTNLLVCCSAGMSRSLCIAAAAIAKLSGVSPRDALAEVAQDGPVDVSPALWNQMLATSR